MPDDEVGDPTVFCDGVVVEELLVLVVFWFAGGLGPRCVAVEEPEEFPCVVWVVVATSGTVDDEVHSTFSPDVLVPLPLIPPPPPLSFTAWR